MAKALSSLGQASEAYLQNINSILGHLRGNLGVMTVGLQTAMRACAGSVLALSDSDWAGGSDRHSESGTASWVRGKRSWYLHHGNEQETINGRAK